MEKAIWEVVSPSDSTRIKGREFCRSLYMAENIKAGDVITEKNVRSVRPGFGLHPKYLRDVMEKCFVKDCKKGLRLDLSMIDK